MKVLIKFIPIIIIASACSSIKTIKDGRKYEISCHRVTSSDESCSRKAEDLCNKGYKVEKSEFNYVILKGPQRVVTVRCL